MYENQLLRANFEMSVLVCRTYSEEKGRRPFACSMKQVVMVGSLETIVCTSQHVCKKARTLNRVASMTEADRTSLCDS